MQHIEPRLDSIWGGLAELGDPAAQLELGLTFASGETGCADYVAAHKWLNLAAVGGNADAKQFREQLTPEMSADDVVRALRLARKWQEEFTQAQSGKQLLEQQIPGHGSLR